MSAKAANDPTSFRLSEDARRAIGELQERLGLKKSQVIELAVRKLLRSEGADGPKKAPKKPRDDA